MPELVRKLGVTEQACCHRKGVRQPARSMLASGSGFVAVTKRSADVEVGLRAPADAGTNAVDLSIIDRGTTSLGRPSM
jgi:hypothetical protein